MQSGEDQKDTRCYSCLKETTDSDKITFKFKDCKKDHETQICKACFRKNQTDRHNLDLKICYLCTSSLANVGNYRTVKMQDCQDKNSPHSALLCNDCFGLYNALETPPKCYVCHELDPAVEECGICREEIEVDLFQTLNKCQKRPYHRIKVCMDCVTGDAFKDDMNIEDPTQFIQERLGCKYCANREYYSCGLMYGQKDFLSRYAIPCFIIGENELNSKIRNVDPEQCTKCFPVAIGSKLLNKVPVPDPRSMMFLQGSATAMVNKEVMIMSGGFFMDSLGKLSASNSSCALRFVKEVNIQHFHFPINIDPAPLNNRRYFHKMLYNATHGILACFGGMDIEKNGRLVYMDSIETAEIKQKTARELGNEGGYTWVNVQEKMKRKRASLEGFVHGDYAYLFGGFCGRDKQENSIERFNYTTKVTEVLDFKVPGGFVFPTATLLFQKSEGEFWIIGGQQGKSKSNKVYRVSPESQEVEEVAGKSLNQARSGHKGMSFIRRNGTSCFIVFGGAAGDVNQYDRSMDFEVYSEEGATGGWDLVPQEKILDLNLSAELTKIGISRSIVPFTDCIGFKFDEVNLDQIDN